jgi:hypothetical protein
MAVESITMAPYNTTAMPNNDIADQPLIPAQPDQDVLVQMYHLLARLGQDVPLWLKYLDLSLTILVCSCQIVEKFKKVFEWVKRRVSSYRTVKRGRSQRKHMGFSCFLYLEGLF